MKFSWSGDRAFEIYLKEIEDIPTLSREEERELLIKAKNGDRDAIAKLVYAHLKFVVHIASKYQGYGVPISDLINEGNLGLLKAIEHFDLSKKVRFLSYAIWWIKQSIYRALDLYSSTVRITPEKRARLKEILETEKRLVHETGFPPSIYEVAEEMGLSPEDIAEARLLARRDVSLDMPVGKDERDTTLGDVLEQAALPSPDEIYEAEEMREILLRLLHRLDKKERNILVLYFGLEGQPQKTLEEIGEIFNISRERVRQIKDRAIEKLRKWHSEDLKDFVEEGEE
ncbi:MAG: RNA polymerase sigma factor RpoD/SigA [candidate division WOR-3 bacterium]